MDDKPVTLPTVCPKSNYNRVVKQSIITLFRDGKSAMEIAKHHGISNETLFKWISKDKSLSDAISKAKDDYMRFGAEASMSDLATGKATTKEVVVCEKKDKDTGEWIESSRITTIKNIPPDYRAARFIMHNRFRNKWNKPSVSTLDLSGMSDQQLDEFAEMVLEFRKDRAIRREAVNVIAEDE